MLTIVAKLQKQPPRGVLKGKGVLKLCGKFTGEHTCRSAISVKMLSNFIGIALPHGCSPVNFQHILKTSFPRKTSGWLLLKLIDVCRNPAYAILFQDDRLFEALTYNESNLLRIGWKSNKTSLLLYDRNNFSFFNHNCSI